MNNEKRLIYLDDLLKFPIRKDHYDKEHGNEHFVFGVESVLEYAEYLPTVDAVEVVHGRWIRHPDDLFPAESTQECSICHEHEYFTLCNENYCPNCGARMDGDKNE